MFDLKFLFALLAGQQEIGSSALDEGKSLITALRGAKTAPLPSTL